MMINTIIVDDMPLAIASLKADLEDNFNDIKVLGEALGVMAAAKLVKSVKPDLIFLDIHMGDGDGFDLLEMIATDNIQVIFTTASQDHAIKAFQFNAVDYLLKPVSIPLLEAAIQKVRNRISNEPVIEESQATLALNTQSEIRLVQIKDIVRLEAMGNYTQFFMVDKSKVLVTKTLKEFDLQLSNSFIRVHQSHLVNKDQIKAYIKTEGGYLKMKDDSDVPVSVRKKSYVMDLLK